MASIIKRKSKYSVVYRYVDENGVERQKWETFDTNAEAKKRKTELEYQQNTEPLPFQMLKRYGNCSLTMYQFME